MYWINFSLIVLSTPIYSFVHDPLDTISTKETVPQCFLEILKHCLQNVSEIMKTCLIMADIIYNKPKQYPNHNPTSRHLKNKKYSNHSIINTYMM